MVPLHRISLKAKLALAGGLAIGVCVLLLATLLLRVMETDLRRVVADGQMDLLTEKALALDERLARSQDAIAQNALVMSGRHRLSSAAELEGEFNNRPVLRSMFDALLVIDGQGRLVFDSPSTPGRVGLDLSDRQYVRDVLHTGLPVLAHPLRARSSGDPVVLMAAPIRDSGGRVVGMLAGALNLHGRNFLGDLGREKVGKGGYFALIAKGPQPVIVMHGQRERILTEVPKQPSAHLAAALAGRDGAVEGVNSAGLKAIYSYKSLGSAPWLLVSAYPSAEAYATLQQTGREIQVLAAALALFGFAGFFVIASGLLRPLMQLRDAIEANGVNAADVTRQQPVPVGGSPEIVAVGRAYNGFVERAREHQEALRTSEERIRSMLAHAPDAFVGIDASSRITEWNRQAELTFGWQRDEVLGRPLAEVVIPPAQREAHLRGMRRFVESGEGPVVNQRVEVTALHRNGREIPIELCVAAVREGDHYVANAFMRDISERKAAQAQLAASEKLVRDVTNHIPAMIGYCDDREVCHFINEPARQRLGLEPGDPTQYTARTALGEEAYAQHLPHIRGALDGKASSWEFISAKGAGPRHLQAHIVPDRSAEGRVRGFYLMTFDITALKEAEEARAAGERMIRTIADNLPVLISYIDGQERLQFCNATFRRWLGVEPAMAVGRPLREVIGQRLYDERREPLRQALGGRRVDFEKTSEALGRERHLQTVYMPDLRADGEVAGVYTISTDVTPLKQVELQLSRLARHDVLTGLPNRLHFDEKLAEALARCRRSRRPMAVLFMDIDKFKAINDTWGHAGGDEVLKEFALRLSHCVRTTDTVARLAGDEFVIVLEGLNTVDEPALVAEKVIAAMKPAMMVQDHALRVSTSVGIAVSSLGDDEPSALLHAADLALYEAKAAGRNTWRQMVQDRPSATGLAAPLGLMLAS